MAVSKQDQTLEKRMEETAAFITKTREDLEERFGMLYLNGKPKELCAAEKKKLMALYKPLEDLKKSIEIFQRDSSEVCGKFDNSLKRFEMRAEPGRVHAAERDSGIGSANILLTPTSSSNRLSRGDTDNTNRESQSVTNTDNNSNEEAYLFIPSVSGKNSETTDKVAENETTTKKTVPSFYIETPPPSTSSLNGQDACVFPPMYTSDTTTADECSATSTDEQKPLNDLSKPPSEEDNTKHSGV